MFEERKRRNELRLAQREDYRHALHMLSLSNHGLQFTMSFSHFVHPFRCTHCNTRTLLLLEGSLSNYSCTQGCCVVTYQQTNSHAEEPRCGSYACPHACLTLTCCCTGNGVQTFITLSSYHT